MIRNRRQNWLEDCAIVLNEYSWYVGDRETIVMRLFNETKYNKHILSKAYNMLFENNQIKPFYLFDTYFF